MARLTRVVVPGMPHHVVQRGNRRQDVFFNDEDRDFYLDLLNDSCKKYGVAIWSWCLMANHVHFVAVPKKEESGGRPIGSNDFVSKIEGKLKRVLQRGVPGRTKIGTRK